MLSSEIIKDNQALRNIKEVTTQKPVICLSEDKNSEELNKLKQLLPHSKPAQIKRNPKKKNALILRTPEEAELIRFFEGINYAVVLDNKKN